MKITKEVQADARRLMRLCTTPEGGLDEAAVRRIAGEITQRKPRNYAALLCAFTDLVRLVVQRNTATVQSAVALTEEERSAIESRLSAKHPHARFEWQEEPSLIAGIRVQLGDDVTDASVRARIQQISALSAK